MHDGTSEVDVASCDPETLRRLRRNRISMVFQQFGLMPWLTVRDNVGFGLEIRGVDKAERDDGRRQAQAGAAREVRRQVPHELSGGMQQRVGLARAFATEASILLMDEPFSALDPLIREHLQDELIELQRKLKKTIVFVSHDLDEALKIGTRIAIMEAGRVVQFGVPEDIVIKPVNDYVRQFVASMNPLTVLKGGTLMRPIAICRASGRRHHPARPRRPMPLPARQPRQADRPDGRRRRASSSPMPPISISRKLPGPCDDLRHRAHADARRGHRASA